MKKIIWPEKEIGCLHNHWNDFACSECSPKNEAIDLCRKAYEEAEEVTTDELGFIIYKFWQNLGEQTARDYWTAKHHKDAWKTRSSNLATAITKYLRGNNQQKGESK